MSTPDETAERRRWRLAKSYFDQLVDLPAADREARLDAIDREADGPAVRRLVESLLDSDARSTEWFGDSGPAPRLPALGESLGDYELVREIGRGGSGVVYLARRIGADFDRQVAIKVLSRALDADSLRRFQRERRILAGLEHSGIAHLIDGGATEDDQPYVVMEWVDGEAITLHCDRHKLPIESRLRLFLRVCQALEHAHGRLVVHCDIKPSNLLVAADGQPKLLDFGIAKLLEGSQIDSDAKTTSARWLSPAYASPEQVVGAPLSTASDIYSLGVVLHELLVGERPETPSMLDLIEDDKALPIVPSPSSAVSADAAAARATSESALRRRLRGDLDAIVGRALRLEPDRRYRSVTAFASDIRRHLDHHPVEARRDELFYRVGRRLRRHAVLAVTLASVVLGAIGFGVVGTRHAQRLERERDVAERQRLQAEVVSDVLVDLFQMLDPFTGETLDPRARAILDRGRERVEQQLGDQPERRSELFTALGVTYRGLGFFDEAQRLLTTVVDDLDPRSTEWAAAMHELGQVYEAAGEYDRAEATLGAALERREQLFGDEHPSVAETLAVLGTLAQLRGDLDSAAERLRRAVEIDHRQGMADTAAAADRQHRLGLVVLDQGDVAAARRFIDTARQTFEAIHGRQHIDVSDTLTNLGVTYYAEGDSAEAERLMSESLAIRIPLQGEDHPDVATLLNNLAAMVHQSGDLRRAEGLYRRSLDVDRRRHGDDHPMIASAMTNLGLLLLDLGELDDATELIETALATKRNHYEPDHASIATSLVALGLLELERHRPAAAIANFREAEAMQRRLLGDDHWLVGSSHGYLARAELLAGRPTVALEHARQARETLAATLAETHTRRAEVDAVLGAVLAETGRRAEGVALLRAAHARLLEAKGPDARSTREAAAWLAKSDVQTLVTERPEPSRSSSAGDSDRDTR